MKNSFDIDSYGVWVKTGPQDVTEINPDTNGRSLDIADLPDFDFDKTPFESSDSNMESFEDSVLEPVEVFDSSLDDTVFAEESSVIENSLENNSFNDTDFPSETVLDDIEDSFDMSDFSFDDVSAFENDLSDSDDFSEPEFPEAAGDEMCISQEAVDADEGFENEISIESEMPVEPKETAENIEEEPVTHEKTADHAVSDASFILLQQIAEELASIKVEVSGLKKEFDALKERGNETEIVSAAQKESVEPVSKMSGGFFADDDGDETIALSGDELHNIFQSAEFVDESESLEPQSVPAADEQAAESIIAVTDFSIEEPVMEREILPENSVEEQEEDEEETALNFDELSNILNTADFTEEEADTNDIYDNENFIDIPESETMAEIEIEEETALNPDELSNILNTAQFTEEDVFEQESAEETNVDDFFLDSDVTLNFDEEKLEEPKLEDLDFELEDELEDETVNLDIRIPTADSILVESDGKAETDDSEAILNQPFAVIDAEELSDTESVDDPAKFLDANEDFPIAESLDENNLAYLTEDDHISDSLEEEELEDMETEKLPLIEDIQINEDDFDLIADELEDTAVIEEDDDESNEIKMNVSGIEDDVNLDIPFDSEPQFAVDKPLIMEPLYETVLSKSQEDEIEAIPESQGEEENRVTEKPVIETEEISLDAFDIPLPEQVDEPVIKTLDADEFSVEEESFSADSQTPINDDFDEEHISLEADEEPVPFEDPLVKVQPSEDSFADEDISFDEPVVDEESFKEVSFDEPITQEKVFEEVSFDEPVREDEIIEEELADISLPVEQVSENMQPPSEPENQKAASGSAIVPSELKDEIKQVLRYMDQLLENLPEEKIEEFAKSEHFEVYKRLFSELGIS